MQAHWRGLDDLPRLRLQVAAPKQDEGESMHAMMLF